MINHFNYCYYFFNILVTFYKIMPALQKNTSLFFSYKTALFWFFLSFHLTFFLQNLIIETRGFFHKNPVNLLFY